MPLKLVPPRAGKTPFYSVRGTYLGVHVDRSTKTGVKSTASKILKRWRDEIERGAVAKPGEPTFLDAAVNYIAATDNDSFIAPLSEHFGLKPLRLIDQQAVDVAAIKLYPNCSPATRNRQVYTPVSAILKHAGFEWKLRRPKGWRGKERTDWLRPEQAFRVFEEARGVDEEFAIFLILLCYTGLRLKEATVHFQCDRLSLSDAYAYIPETKNGAPRAVHLPPVVVSALAGHPRGLDRGTLAVFRFRKNGRLYALLKETASRSGVKLAFHLFRHTWGAWMRRYGGLDRAGLKATNAWRDDASIDRYMHVDVAEESRRADLLPVPKVASRA